MKIHTYENAFLVVGAITLVACMAALAYGSVALHIHLPSREARIDPLKLRETPPFDQPGVREVAPGKYEVVMTGQIWSFAPSVIELPRGAEVTFIVSTPDVIHGFLVENTRVNMMLIPGQVSKSQHRFTTPGEFAIICHEYCGVGHHTMYGKLVIK